MSHTLQILHSYKYSIQLQAKKRRGGNSPTRCLSPWTQQTCRTISGQRGSDSLAELLLGDGEPPPQGLNNPHFKSGPQTCCQIHTAAESRGGGSCASDGGRKEKEERLLPHNTASPLQNHDAPWGSGAPMLLQVPPSRLTSAGNYSPQNHCEDAGPQQLSCHATLKGCTTTGQGLKHKRATTGGCIFGPHSGIQTTKLNRRGSQVVSLVSRKFDLPPPHPTAPGESPHV